VFREIPEKGAGLNSSRIYHKVAKTTVVPGAFVTYHLNVAASSTFNGMVALGVAHLPQSCTWDATGKVSCGAEFKKSELHAIAKTLGQSIEAFQKQFMSGGKVNPPPDA
jgi:hypothetical protein